MQTTTAGAKANAPGAGVQRTEGESERMAEMETMFISLVGNFEDLADRYAALCRRLGALELERAAEAVSS